MISIMRMERVAEGRSAAIDTAFGLSEKSDGVPDKNSSRFLEPHIQARVCRSGVCSQWQLLKEIIGIHGRTVVISCGDEY